MRWGCVWPEWSRDLREGGRQRNRGKGGDRGSQEGAAEGRVRALGSGGRGAALGSPRLPREPHSRSVGNPQTATLHRSPKKQAQLVLTAPPLCQTQGNGLASAGQRAQGRWGPHTPQLRQGAPSACSSRGWPHQRHFSFHV